MVCNRFKRFQSLYFHTTAEIHKAQIAALFADMAVFESKRAYRHSRFFKRRVFKLNQRFNRGVAVQVSLQDEAIVWLEEKQQDSGFIFLNRFGERITTRGISGQLKKLALKYGIDPAVVYPHSFRHRFAKSFLDRCSDIAFLADLMGHESIETTRIYLRKTATEQRTLVDNIVDW